MSRMWQDAELGLHFGPHEGAQPGPAPCLRALQQRCVPRAAGGAGDQGGTARGPATDGSSRCLEPCRTQMKQHWDHWTSLSFKRSWLEEMICQKESISEWVWGERAWAMAAWGRSGPESQCPGRGAGFRLCSHKCSSLARGASGVRWQGFDKHTLCPSSRERIRLLTV